MNNKQSLEQKTRVHWDQYSHGNPEPCLQQYMEHLLPGEMSYVQQYRPSSLPSETCDLLVLLVGLSIEPLLQSIYAYKPKKVLFVLNKRYGRSWSGKNWGDMVARLLAGLPEPPQVEVEIVEAGPVQVFKALLKRVRQTDGVIVDITGAKKNMVAGAFLFAALAEVPVSYVDFDEDAYDPERGKPYGYGCQIGRLRNPYETFALRDWERMRELYRRYKFRDARSLLVGENDDSPTGTILETMKDYLPDSEQAIRCMVDVLRCYELWDAGDYNPAADLARAIDSFEPPMAVSALDGKWYSTDGVEFVGGLHNFYEDTAEFRAYVYDELARIERLIKFNHDYRSAFLRAGSLSEVVMLARLVKAVGSNPQKAALLNALQSRTPDAKSLFEGSLLRPAGESFKIGKGKQIRFAGAPSITVKVHETMHRWWKQTRLFNGDRGWEEFINRRNDLTHKYFSPPLEWATDALAFVQANVQDFWGTGGNVVNTEAIRWSELCQLTGMEQYLPPNLTANGGGKERT